MYGCHRGDHSSFILNITAPSIFYEHRFIYTGLPSTQWTIPIQFQPSFRRSAPLHRDRVALKQTQVMQRQKTRPPNDLIWSHLISFDLIHKASSHRCLFWQQRCCAHDDVTLPQGIHFLALQAPNPMTTRLKHSKRAQRSDGNTPRFTSQKQGLFGAIWGSRLSLLFRWGTNLVLWSATLLQRPRIKTHTSKEHAAMHAMRVTSRDVTESCRYIHYIGYRWWIICYCYGLWLYDR